MITRKTTRIIGITLIIIGLSVFGISHDQGLVGQNVYSNLDCAVDATPKQCVTAENQMAAGFIGMIFAFFRALFGASLVVPPVLMKLIKRIQGRGHMNVIILLPLFLLVVVTPAISHGEKPYQIAPDKDK